MKKIYLLLLFLLSLSAAFSQGSIINGTVFNDLDGTANGMNGTGTLPVTLYAHLVHEKNGDPNDLEVINSININNDGTYSIISPNHQISSPGYYKVIINKYIGFPFSQPFETVPAMWLSGSGTLPSGIIYLDDYNGMFGDNVVDGISGAFILQRPLCTGDEGSPEWEECMNNNNIPIQISSVNFSIQQTSSNFVNFLSDSPKCEGQDLYFSVASSTAETPTYTITDQNGIIVSNNQILNTTTSQSGIYTVSGSFSNGDTFTETTEVTIQPRTPINFISGPTNLNINPGNIFYGVDAPFDSDVTYSISPANAGTIIPSQLTTMGGLVYWKQFFVGEATISAEYSNLCGTTTTTRTVTINGPIIINITNDSPKCEGQTLNFASNLIASDEPYTITGPQGQISGTSLNNITASQAGIYTITMASTGISVTTEVIINALPPNIAFTSGATNLTFNPPNEIYTTDAPIDWVVNYSISPQNAGVISTTGELNLNDSFRGTVSVTASITNNCGTKTITRYIDIPLYEITSNSPVCEGETIIFTLKTNPGPNAGFELEGPNGYVLDDGNDLIISIPNAQINDAGDYTLTAFTWLSSAIVNVVVNTAPPSIQFTSGAESIPQNSVNEIYSTNAPIDYEVNYSISPLNAGTISANGEVNWEASFSGQATITASISNDCGSESAIRLVDINCVAPLFTFNLESNSPICVGETLVLNIVLDENSSILYMLTGPNGQVSPEIIANATLTNAGTYTISTENGCGATIYETVNVLVNAPPPFLQFTSGATNLPQNAPNEIYSTDAPIGYDVVYSISPLNAGTISTKGEVNWEINFTGQATISASISNDCGTETVEKIVSITLVYPEIICPNNILIPVATGITSAVASYTAPQFSDGTTVQIIGLASGSSFPLGNSTIILEATNLMGNITTCSFIIAVYPESAPLVENSQIPNAVPDPTTGNYNISSTIFDVTVPSGEIISGLLIITFPEGAESITINLIKYGPPLPGGRIKLANSKVQLIPFPTGGVIIATNAAGKPNQPVIINPNNGETEVKIDYVAINGNNILSPLPATITINFISSPLPISLLQFSGKQIDEDIILTWKTTNETNFSHFEVQKSENGKEFGVIGKIQSNEFGFYNFIDSNSNEGVNFYKLKMIDLNGTSSFSKTISLNFEKNFYYFSVENPVKNGEILIRSNYINPDFTLLNSLGQKITISTTEISDKQFKIKPKSIHSGIYFLMIESGGKVESRKVIVE